MYYALKSSKTRYKWLKVNVWKYPEPEGKYVEDCWGLRREQSGGLEGVTPEQRPGARMDMEWIYFESVLERKRGRETGSVMGVSPAGVTPTSLRTRMSGSHDVGEHWGEATLQYCADKRLWVQTFTSTSSQGCALKGIDFTCYVSPTDTTSRRAQICSVNISLHVSHFLARQCRLLI